ncbi:MAG TPA: hypothetical protein VFX72_01670, partial [Usitatibacteraceae bacterium]|nr:hypothetical protein [Usitatibacteraceae bacterium]
MKERKPSSPKRPRDAPVPVSQRIRERLRKARERYHANDNIAKYIEPGELAELQDEVEAKMR